MKIIICDQNNVDLDGVKLNFSFVDTGETLTKLTQEDKDQELYILDSLFPNVESFLEKGDELFMPPDFFLGHLEKLNSLSSKSIYLYFDLEHYPSSKQMLKELDEMNANQNGVLRIRRMSGDKGIIKKSLADLYVLSQQFGKGESFFAKTVFDEHSGTGHFIISIRFGQDVMAHLEYSIFHSNKEKLEMEWSSLNTVLAYSSDQQALSVLTGDSQRLLLDAESILSNSKKVSRSLEEELKILLEQLPQIAKEDGR
ncbi:hypothetical protein [Bacillus sp. REN3]|uniref:hypothetical protein n=1 Tax=Bacillus sp. REN3 TaxID=2802440 RepID=UPI001AEE4C73|nr:hypothetical protein [Bacillus sp. REN3]